MNYRKLNLLFPASAVLLGGLIFAGVILAQQTDRGPASVRIDGSIDIVTFFVEDPDGVCSFFIRAGSGQGLASGGGGGASKRFCNLTSKRVGPFRISGYSAPFFPLKVEVTDRNDNAYSFTADRGATDEIKYPIPELGNCSNKEECKTYCQTPENIKACINFAEKNNLISADGAVKSRAIADMISGPGGCKDKNACEAYCNNIDHISECLEFGERSGLMSDEELSEAKKVSKAIRSGVQMPGNCKNKNQCKAYCDESSNMEECLNFAIEAGFIPADEIEEARKVSKAMASGIRPPGNCEGKKQCEVFCANPDNMEECVDFASKAGLIPPEEIAQVRKIIPLMQQGLTPGGCKSKSQCEAYCDDESHSSECADFAVRAGFITPEEAEMIKKTGGRGPGNCRSREACDSYCKDESHIDECMEFAVGAGLISKEEAEMVKKLGISSGPGGCKGKAECEAFCALPQNQNTCFEFAKEHGLISEEDAGSFGQQPDLTECLSKTTCGDFFSCLDPDGSRSSQRGGQEGERSGTLPPELQRRVDSCQEEVQKAEQEKADERINACLAKPCAEFLTCVSSLERGGEGDGEQQGQSASNSAIEAKVQSCIPKDRSGEDGGRTQSPPSDVPEGFSSPEVGERPPVGTTPPPDGTSGGAPVTPESCSSFESVPACSFVGSPDSPGYQLCAKCFPAKAQQLPYKSPDPSPFSFRNHSFLGAISRFLLK